MTSTADMTLTTGYYDKDTGAQDLLRELYLSSTHDSGASPYELLGDSRRQSPSAVAANAEPVEFKGIRLNGWVIGCNKTHITPVDDLDKIGEAAKLTPPEMVFGRNQLLFYHEASGVCYNFLAIEALKGAHFSPPESEQAADIIAQQQLKVSVAKHNSNKEDVKELDISYDWTFTTDYKGTLQRVPRQREGVDGDAPTFSRSEDVKVEPTEERIDLDKLREREPILWFEEVGLFEDELHDHGISVMTIKVRVMPSGFYVLARYWMRLDHVVVRLHETRVHHLFGRDYMIREYTRKEEQFETLFANGHPRGMANYTNIDTYQQHLPVRETAVEKVFIQ
ncbi:hypothetical protein ATCC90586_004364 [Pythium insidiosum]|nr:hypothetical protein ATCC90586_004364 [Pythium insidiosum]